MVILINYNKAYSTYLYYSVMIFITRNKVLITYYIQCSNNSVNNFFESLILVNFHWATQITIKAISRPGTVKLALILVPRTRIEWFFTFVCDRTLVVKVSTDFLQILYKHSTLL